MRSMLVSSVLLCAMTANVWAADSYTPINEAKIVAGTGVRVRAEPNTNAKEVGKLSFGTTITSTQRTKTPSKIGTNSAYWYQVATPLSGWVFGGFLQTTDASKPDAAALALLRSKLGAADVVLDEKTLRFADAVEVSQFAEKAAQVAKDTQSKGELALDKWRAVQASFLAIEPAQMEKPPYLDWFKSHGDKVYYHELAAAYFVNANTLWALADEYQTAAIGDAIAWQAANAALGGECEGFIDCSSGRSQMMEGEYLLRYPHGKHVKDALMDVQEVVDYALKDAPNQKDAIKEVDFKQWDKILTPVADSPLKTKVVKGLAKLKSLQK